MRALIEGFEWGQVMSQQEAEAQHAAEHRERQDIIGACMAEQGFDWNPEDDPGTVHVVALSEDDGPAWGSRDFAERYGFGISVQPASSVFTAPDPGPSEWVDPNADLLAAMSPGEREAWQVALYGDPALRDDHGEWDWLEHGCWGYAHWRQEHRSLGEDDRFAALRDELNRIWDRVLTDPRVGVLDAEWAACMTDAGHPGLRRTGENSLTRNLWDEWERLNGWGPAVDEQLAEWDWHAYPDGPEGLFPSPASVTAFTELELTLAIADYDCRTAVEFDTRLTEIDHDVQQQFVDLHRAELEAWAEYAAARRDG